MIKLQNSTENFKIGILKLPLLRFLGQWHPSNMIWLIFIFLKIGIVSTGFYLLPSVFTNISPNYKWITDTKADASTLNDGIFISKCTGNTIQSNTILIIIIVMAIAIISGIGRSVRWLICRILSLCRNIKRKVKFISAV